MLTPNQIAELINAKSLSDFDVLDIIETLVKYQEINFRQAELLGKCLDELDAMRARLDFYRSTTIKLV